MLETRPWHGSLESEKENQPVMSLSAENIDRFCQAQNGSMNGHPLTIEAFAKGDAQEKSSENDNNERNLLLRRRSLDDVPQSVAWAPNSHPGMGKDGEMSSEEEEELEEQLENVSSGLPSGAGFV